MGTLDEHQTFPELAEETLRLKCFTELSITRVNFKSHGVLSSA